MCIAAACSLTAYGSWYHHRVSDPRGSARPDPAARGPVRRRGVDPRYLDDVRAVVRQDDGRIQDFDVPQGLTMKVGDRVASCMISYRSNNAPCSYIPILITEDDVPIA